MKKYFTLTVVLFLISFQSHCQEWEWAKHLGFNSQLNNETTNSLVTDGVNFYAIGAYWGSLNTPGGTLSSNGLNDIFIIKYDANGNQLWAKSLGGNYTQPDNLENGYGVFDPVNQCLYISGQIMSLVVFEPDKVILNAQSNKPDAFVAKMDLDGHFLWAKKIGGMGIDESSCSVDEEGNAFLVGTLQNGGSCNGISVPAGGFFARFDTDGNLKWIEQKFTGIYFFTTACLGSDIIMGGYFNSVATIDTATIASSGDWDGFLTRTDSLGHVKWIKTFGNIYLDGISHISTDNSNNIYITGVFKDSINLCGTVLKNAETDFLLAKLDENGNLLWARQAHIQGNNQYVAGIGLISDAIGNTYSTGVFGGTATFGNYTVSSVNNSDMFLTRYDNSGNCLGVKNFGYAIGTSMAVDNDSNVVCCGRFQDAVTIGSVSFISYGGWDIFIAKTGEINGICVDKKAIANELLIYANPTTGKCTVSIPDEFLLNSKLTLTIFNSTGYRVQQKTFSIAEGKIKIDLESEARGIYIAKLSNGIKEYSGKIIFE